ncbi:MAG: PDZ domain-containing protein, partial [Deltaproteobacteria bacterium]
APPGSPPAPAAPEESFARWVHATGPGAVAIDRTGLAEHLRDPARLHGGRVVPAYRDGAYHGIKLVGVRSGSLFRALGLRSGDVVTAVNGQPIDSPARGLELYDALQSASDITVRIERHGRDETLRYTMR